MTEKKKYVKILLFLLLLAGLCAVILYESGKENDEEQQGTLVHRTAEVECDGQYSLYANG